MSETLMDKFKLGVAFTQPQWRGVWQQTADPLCARGYWLLNHNRFGTTYERFIVPKGGWAAAKSSGDFAHSDEFYDSSSMMYRVIDEFRIEVLLDTPFNFVSQVVDIRWFTFES